MKCTSHRESPERSYSPKPWYKKDTEEIVLDFSSQQTELETANAGTRLARPESILKLLFFFSVAVLKSKLTPDTLLYQ